MQKSKKPILSIIIFGFWFVFFVFGFCFFDYYCFAQNIKKADLAGSWYPKDANELSLLLDKFLSAVPTQEIDGKIIALIQPHAGLIYSGPVAAYGFNLIKNSGIKTVVVVGFSHRKHFSGVSVYNQGAIETPLGEIFVDKELADALISQNPKIKFYPQAFDEENSVEMQFPFIKKTMPGALVVPVAIGEQSVDTAQDLADALYNTLKERDDVLLIASSDMSHYLPYQEAIEADSRTINALKEMSAETLFRHDSLSGGNTLCGVFTVASVLTAAEKLGRDAIEILNYVNSGDTTSDKSRVVGYVSAAIYKSRAKSQDLRTRSKEDESLNKKEGKDMFTQAQRKRLLEIARQTITEYLASGKIKDFEETGPALLEEKGAFVTLHNKRGELRGCIGNIIGRIPLYKTVRDMSIESATGDPRFPSLTLLELKDIKIEISVLSVPIRELNPENIIMGKHGVIIRKGYRSGVFLPQVALETGWSRAEFLSNLCAHKAGLSPDAWKDKDAEILTFTAEVFSEE